MPLSIASKLGIQFARFVAASGNATSGAHHGLRGAFSNTSAGAGSSSAGSSGATSSWAAGLSSGGGASSANGAHLGGAKFHAGRGAHSSFQQSGRAIVNANASTAHDGTTTIGDEEEEASSQAARIHRPKSLHRSAILARHSSLATFAARQHFSDTPLPPALQLILPSSLPRSASGIAFLHTAARQAELPTTSAENEQLLAASDAGQALLATPSKSRIKRSRSLSTSATTASELQNDAPLSAALDRAEGGGLATAASKPMKSRSGKQDLVPMYMQLMEARNTGNARKISVAVERYRSLPKDQLSTPAFNIALEALLVARRPGEDIGMITDTYVQMINSSCLPNIRTMSTMVKVLCAHDAEQVTGRWQQEPVVDAAELSPEAKAINLDTFGQALSMVSVTHSSMNGFPNVHPYNAILRSCMLRGDAARACDILNLLSNNRRVSANADTFILLIKCLANDKASNPEESPEQIAKRKLEACRQVFEEFEESRASEGWETSPKDTSVWNAMLRVTFELGDSAAAIQLLEVMLSGRSQDGRSQIPPTPSPATSETILKGFMNNKDWDSAIMWFNRILDYNASNDGAPTSAMPLPSMAALSTYGHSLLLFISELRIRDTTVDDLGPLERVLGSATRSLTTLYDLAERGTDGEVDVNLLCNTLKANAAAAHVYVREKMHEKAGEYFDLSLSLVKRHFDTYGFGLNVRQPSKKTYIFVEEVRAAAHVSEGFRALISELIAAGRIQDAASLFSYLPPLMINLDMRVVANSNPKHPEFFEVWKNTCNLGLEFLKAAEDGKANRGEVLISAAEMVIEPLSKLGAATENHTRAFVELYQQVRSEIDISKLPLSKVGWENIFSSFAKMEATVKGETDPFMTVLDDVAKLPKATRDELEIGSLAEVIVANYGDEGRAAIAALQPWHPLSSVAGSPSAETVSETSQPMSLESMMQGYSSPNSSVDILSSLPAVQMIDEDFSFSIEQQAKGSRNGPSPGRSDGLGATKRVREAIHDIGTYPSASAINALICAAGRRGDIDTVHELYHIGCHVVAAMGGDLTWQSDSWNKIEDGMMKGLAHAGDAKGASNHRHKLVNAGRVPTADAYAALIAVVRDTTDDALIAEELFEESQRLNVIPTVYLYNTVISKLCRARKIERAAQLFRNMQLLDLKATSITYGALINGYVRTGDEAMAENMFLRMEKDIRFNAKAPPFNTMMQFYTYTQPDRAKALHYFQKMRNLRVEPTGFTYKIYLDIFGTIAPIDLTGLERAFGELIADRRVAVEGNHWASLMCAHGIHCQDIDKAIAIFESIPAHPTTRQARSVRPLYDAIMYEALLNVFLTHGRIDLMNAYLQQMRDHNIHPTAYVANLFIKGLGEQDVQQARVLFAEMHDPPMGVAAAGNHPPNHRQHANAEQAASHAAPSTPAGISPSAGFAGVLREPSTFETMIRVELSHGNKDEASALLERMEHRGYPPALVTKARTLLVEGVPAAAPASDAAPEAQPTNDAQPSAAGAPA